MITYRELQRMKEEELRKVVPVEVTVRGVVKYRIEEVKEVKVGLRHDTERSKGIGQKEYRY